MTDAASPSVQGFKDLVSLRARHLQLLGCETTEKNGSDKVSADAVQEFLQRAKASGAILSDTDDRDAAQRVIDYWSADLVAVERSYGALGEKKALDPCRPDPTVAASPGAAPVAEETYKKSQAQQDIRVAIVARRWRDTKSDAYLLSGDALENASKFDRDTDTARLIMANVAAERKTKVRQSQMKNRLIALMGAVCSAERCDVRADSGAGGAGRPWLEPGAREEDKGSRWHHQVCYDAQSGANAAAARLLAADIAVLGWKGIDPVRDENVQPGTLDIRIENR